MPCWHGRSHKERGTLRSSVLKELKFNLNLQMDEHGKSALAVLEICHVTRRMAGDSPNVLSHHRDKQSPFPSCSFPGLNDKLHGHPSSQMHLPLVLAGCPFCESGYRTVCGGNGC